MTYEIEQKYRIRSPQSMRRILKKLRAKLLHKGKEVNELYDFKGHLKRRKKLLRLRCYDGGKGLLTLKGPHLPGKFKRRMELETAVDFRAAQWILKELGYTLCCMYEKMRAEYAVQNSKVCVDYLKGLGWFVEIEGTPKKILKLVKIFSFHPEDEEHRTYLELLGVKR